MKKYLLSIFICFITLAGYSQKGSIRGFIMDKETGLPVAFANVYLLENLKGDVTDEKGLYNIDKIVDGKYTLVVSYIGYDTLKISIDITGGKVLTKNLYIKESSGIVLDEVQVSAEKQAKSREVQISKDRIDAKELKNLVTIGGEPDLVQSLQVLPGVVSTGDQGGQLYIRGGAPIMNKVILDGMTIYNPFHSIGLFSVFDADIIRTADVYSAGFGAEYGGRISAIVDVSTREGKKNKFSGKLASNPFTSKILIEGPLKKFKEGTSSSSYIFSYKTSYLEQSSKIFYPYIDAARLPYTFTDLYGKMSFSNGQGTRFDVFGFNFKDAVNFPGATQYGWNSYGLGTKFVALPEGSRTLIDGFVSYSSYEMVQTEIDNKPRNSSINGFNTGLNFSYLLANDEIKYGAEINGFSTNFETFNANNRRLSQQDNNTELGLYIRYKKVTPRWVIEPGFRLMFYASLPEFSPEPRLALKYKASKNFRLKAAGGFYSQNLMAAVSDRDVVNLFYGFLASPENLPKSLNGNPVTSRLQKARHAVGGFEWDIIKNIEFGAEAYIKEFDQITNINRDKIFDDNEINASKPDFLKKDYVVETGRAYGFDFKLKYEYKKFYLWMVYSYTYITRNDGVRTYFPNFDRRHNFNIVSSYKWGKNDAWQANLRWNYGSGLPFTFTQGFYENLNFNQGVGSNYTGANGDLGILYGDINTGRLPSFHRLDFSLERKFKFKKTDLNIIFSCVNVYNRANVFYFDRVNYTRVDQLPILPSLGFNFSF